VLSAIAQQVATVRFQVPDQVDALHATDNSNGSRTTD
jgi:hypothetical protein